MKRNFRFLHCFRACLLVFLLLHLLIPAFAQADKRERLDKAKHYFDRGKKPADVAALVGGYVGQCVTIGNGPDLVVPTVFGYFKTLNSGTTYYGANLSEKLPKEILRGQENWDGLQSVIGGRSWDSPWGKIYGEGKSGSIERADAFVTYTGSGYIYEHRTEFRETPVGLVSKVVINGYFYAYCWQYEPFVTREEVPAGYRGPEE